MYCKEQNMVNSFSVKTAKLFSWDVTKEQSSATATQQRDSHKVTVAKWLLLK